MQYTIHRSRDGYRTLKIERSPLIQSKEQQLSINFVHASLPQPSTAMHTYAVPYFFYYDFIFYSILENGDVGSYMGRTWVVHVCVQVGACVCVSASF